MAMHDKVCLCRWEKFAQEKGIQKKKRSVKVWDEDNQEWRRRFGYQRAGDTRDIPIVEAKASDQVRHWNIMTLDASCISVLFMVWVKSTTSRSSKATLVRRSCYRWERTPFPR